MEKKNFLPNVCWNYVIGYIDINSLLNLELVSKSFQETVSYFFKKQVKEKMPEGSTDQDYKKIFLSKTFNSLLQCPVTDEFCNDEQSHSVGNIKEKIMYNDIGGVVLGKKFIYNQIEVFHDNIFLLFQNGNFRIIKVKPESKTVYLYKNITSESKLTYFIYIPQKKSFLFIDGSSNFYTLDEENFELKKHPLKLPITTNLVKMFLLKDYILFLDDQDDFYYIPLNNFPYLSPSKEESEKKGADDDKKEGTNVNFIVMKFTKVYNKIKDISTSRTNIMIIDDLGFLYFTSCNEISKFTTTTIKFKQVSEISFPNYYKMSSGESHWLLLQKVVLPPLKEWTCEEVQRWFEEMKLEDYLNIIKYEKITGKDIENADQAFFIDCMGMQEDEIKKVNYEISQIRHGSFKKIKLYGWGSNKYGQLGLMNYNPGFLKSPTGIPLPELAHNDSVEKIYCLRSSSMIITRFGYIFITGNYNPKGKIPPNSKKNEENNQKSKKDKKHSSKKKGKESKESKEPVITHRWVDITKDICFDSLEESNEKLIFKVKNAFLVEDSIFFFGNKTDKIPFNMIQKKPKFKHLKKGDKFITSDKLIEHILESKKDKISKVKVVYSDACLKMLEDSLEEFTKSEIPYHKIEQLKYFNEIIWDRKKRFVNEEFLLFEDNK